MNTMTTVLLDDVECKITITADGVHLTDGSSEYFKSSLLIAPQSLLPLIRMYISNISMFTERKK